jgi:hypothetical protein
LDVNVVKALQIYFKVPVEVRREEGRFVASCFLLDTLHEGPNKHGALAALTDAVQAYMSACCDARALDEVLQQHDLRLPAAEDELVTGHYIDVSVQLKIPALNHNQDALSGH